MNEQKAPELNRYQRIMERIFFSRYTPGDHIVEFAREEMVRTAERHYRLVSPDDMTQAELETYGSRP